MISSVPPGFVGTDFTSEIRVSADGEFVYGANRLNDTIGAFKIGTDGRLTRISHTSTKGDYPRTFVIDPFGRFMVVGNQAADNVTTFRIEGSAPLPNEVRAEMQQGQRGSLTFTGDYTPVASASGMVFLT
jgi:6-phosphogluconolactonase (cycloisomerase 2 family)